MPQASYSRQVLSSNKEDRLRLALIIALLATTFLVFLVYLLWPSRPHQLAEVEGVVTLDGQPLSEVQVIFAPDTLAGASGPASAAVTDDNGHYRLETIEATRQRDGVVMGQHRVSILDMRGIMAQHELQQSPSLQQSVELRVPSVYANSATTPLQPVHVRAGKQTLDFNVESARR
jgi:hypothetical protein